MRRRGFRTMRQAASPFLLLIGMIAAASFGCVATHESARPIVSSDLSGLVGTWQGTASGAQGLSQPATLMINGDGTYTMTGGTGGVFTSLGTTRVEDGRIVFVSRTTSGGQTADRITTAVLSERTE